MFICNAVCGKVALLYSSDTGMGDAYSSLSDLERVLKEYGFAVIKVDHGNIVSNLATNPGAFYMHGGGGEDVDGTFAFYSSAEKTAIINHVKTGGHYLGVCMGAYLAGPEGFQFLASHDPSVTANENEADISEKSVSIIWTNGKTIKMYVQSPTRFTRAALGADGEVLATYEDSGNIAALVRPFGSGSIGLSGPHYEADSTWGVSGVDGRGSLEAAKYLIDKTASISNSSKVSSNNSKSNASNVSAGKLPIFFSILVFLGLLDLF